MFGISVFMSVVLAGGVTPVSMDWVSMDWPGQTVQIASADRDYRGQCVRVTAATSGAPLVLADCDSGDSSQQWRVMDRGRFSRLQNVQTGMCALGTMGEIEPKTLEVINEISLGTCDNDPDMLWMYDAESRQIMRAPVSEMDNSTCWQAGARAVEGIDCQQPTDGAAQRWNLNGL